jgi:L-ascorbate metabolism protein UlaG (beta-lactamase superfamily)
MYISKLAEGSFKFTAKHNGNDAIVIVNPYVSGSKNAKADIFAYTHGYDDESLWAETHALDEERVAVHAATAGEYEVKKSFVDGIVTGKNTSFVLMQEGIRFAFMAPLGAEKLSEAVIGTFGNIDVLCVPVSEKLLDPKSIERELISMLEPRAIVPVAFDGSAVNAALVEKYAQEYGMEVIKAEKKTRIAPKDLPQDTMRVYLFE